MCVLHLTVDIQILARFQGQRNFRIECDPGQGQESQLPHHLGHHIAIAIDSIAAVLTQIVRLHVHNHQRISHSVGIGRQGCTIDAFPLCFHVLDITRQGHIIAHAGTKAIVCRLLDYGAVGVSGRSAITIYIGIFVYRGG